MLTSETDGSLKSKNINQNKVENTLKAKNISNFLLEFVEITDETYNVARSKLRQHVICLGNRQKVNDFSCPGL